MSESRMIETTSTNGEKGDDGKVKVNFEGDNFVTDLYKKTKQLLEWDVDRPSDNAERPSFVTILEETHAEICECQDEFENRKLFKDGEQLWSRWLQAEGEGRRRLPENDHLKTLAALAFNNRGYLKYLQVDFEGAIHDYTESLKLDSRLACAYYNRGLVTYRLAFFRQSFEDMTNAVKLEPNNPIFTEGLVRVKEVVGSSKGHEFNLQL